MNEKKEASFRFAYNHTEKHIRVHGLMKSINAMFRQDNIDTGLGVKNLFGKHVFNYSQQEYLTRVIWNSNIKLRDQVASEIVGGTEIYPDKCAYIIQTDFVRSAYSIRLSPYICMTQNITPCNTKRQALFVFTPSYMYSRGDTSITVL